MSIDVADCCIGCMSQIRQNETLVPATAPNPVNFDGVFSYDLATDLAAPTFTYSASGRAPTQRGPACGRQTIKLPYGSIALQFSDCPTPAGRYIVHRTVSEPPYAVTTSVSIDTLTIQDGSANVTCTQLTLTPHANEPTSDAVAI